MLKFLKILILGQIRRPAIWQAVWNRICSSELTQASQADKFQDRENGDNVGSNQNHPPSLGGK